MSEEQPQGEHYEAEPVEGATAEPEEATVPVPAGATAAAAQSLKRGPRGTEFTNVNDALAYATACHRSGMLPEHIKTPQQAFVIMDNGAELGLKPWAAWKLLYITKQGRIATMTKGALAVVQACPNFENYEERIELEGTEEMRAVAIAKRRGRKATVKTFSLEDAEGAGLTTRKKNRRGEEYDGPWQSYLKDMLLSRARDRALSIAFAAELAGIELETMAEDADRLEARAAGAPPAESARPPAGEIDMGAEAPKQIAAGRPDPLLMDVLKQQRERVAVKEEATPQKEEIAAGVDEALGPPDTKTPAEEAAAREDKPPKRRRRQKPTKTKTERKTYEVGDIMHGTRRVLEVDGDGRPLMVEKLTEEEMAALEEKPPEKAPETPAHPAPGVKNCPRDYCGKPLNLLGDCDACGWPSANFGKGS